MCFYHLELPNSILVATPSRIDFGQVPFKSFLFGAEYSSDITGDGPTEDTKKLKRFLDRTLKKNIQLKLANAELLANQRLEADNGDDSISSFPPAQETEHIYPKVEIYRPSNYHARAIPVTENFQAFERNFFAGLPDRLFDIFRLKEIKPARSMLVYTDKFLEQYESDLERRFLARNAEAYRCLSETLMATDQLSLIESPSVELGDGVAAWKQLVSVSQTKGGVSILKAIRAVCHVQQEDDDLDDVRYRAKIEAVFQEVTRLNAMPAEMMKIWKPIIYASSLPPSLHLVQERLMLNDDYLHATTDSIFAMIVSSRQFNKDRENKLEVSALKAYAHSSKRPRESLSPEERAEKASTCTFCKKVGHSVATCRKRLKGESAALAMDAVALTAYTNDVVDPL